MIDEKNFSYRPISRMKEAEEATLDFSNNTVKVL